MAESLKDVIARMKNNQQSSQTSKTNPTNLPKPSEEVEEDEDNEEKEKENYSTQEKKLELNEERAEKKPVEFDKDDSKNQEEMSNEERLVREIELLQNNGRFRVELLYQLQEINKALTVIAGVLVDLKG